MENLLGRILTRSELSDCFINSLTFPGMTDLSSSKILCNRCGTVHLKKDVFLPIGAFYCPTCITMSRVRSDELLYHLPQQNFKSVDALKWTGQLTRYQQEISDRLVLAVNQHEQILVHAVTGAGKTEMIYEAINQMLKIGGCTCIATPRIDVCIELHKRLTRDFELSIPLLYGEGKPYFRSPLIIATTHQLLRFREAFDLLIIDEVDAFPFADNEMLYFAANKARKISSTLIYLTATSTDKLEKLVKSNKLKKVHLARRFHNNPLVVPKFFWHTKFKTEFQKQRKSNFPLLIFAPEIEFGKAFADELKEKYQNENIGFVASTTESRLEIVENFRNNKLSILVSTTILERGVTFPKVDVFVITAQHRNFTASALIQIAGRAGRDPERPTGLVSFFHEGRTKEMTRAVNEIKKMNTKGSFSK